MRRRTGGAATGSVFCDTHPSRSGFMTQGGGAECPFATRQLRVPGRLPERHRRPRRRAGPLPVEAPRRSRASRCRVASSQKTPLRACSYMPRGVWPRPTAAAQSRVQVGVHQHGVVGGDGAAARRPPACAAADARPGSATTPVRRLLTGVTSQTMPRAASSASSSGSSTARMPCRRRSACSTSSAVAHATRGRRARRRGARLAGRPRGRPRTAARTAPAGTCARSRRG